MDILFEELASKNGLIGQITLNRPQVLNALSHEMCIAMYGHLERWENDETIQAVVIQGNGERAFCAGGDIRALYLQGRNAEAKTNEYFYDEYRLIHKVKRYKKPYIALMDGITMGGGAGISVHGSYRVATERLLFAMPETSIGFFPDAGGSYFLPRCPGRIGYYLGLTGIGIQAEDAHYAGLVDTIIPSSRINEWVECLLQTDFEDWSSKDKMDEFCRPFIQPPQPSELERHHQEINSYFNQPSLLDIIQALEKNNNLWAKATLNQIQACSPASLNITFRQLYEGETKDFIECMNMEYYLAQQLLKAPDFYEGVRAAVIDKDKKPKWQPAHLSLCKNLLDAYFPKKIEDGLQLKG